MVNKGAYASSPHVVSAYFAAWRKHSTRRWSAIHWFRDGWPVCGLQPPQEPHDFVLPPEPTLTCVRCQRANQAMQRTGKAPPARLLASDDYQSNKEVNS